MCFLKYPTYYFNLFLSTLLVLGSIHTVCSLLLTNVNYNPTLRNLVTLCQVLAFK
jgi:hypothetical protein